MNAKAVLDGHDLKEMFTAGADWLEQLLPELNALNVFPVPDGDTGTNMVYTIRASLDAAKNTDGSVSVVARAIDRGALMGARGNSGVILSQILHGIAEGVKGKDTIDAVDFARALQKASETAYSALSNPVEGTILTVVKDAAAAAQKATLNTGASFVSVVTAAVHSARASVMETPNLLPVLKEAGVVDAGGHGFYTFLEGALHQISGTVEGHKPELLSQGRPVIAGEAEKSHEDFFGFCTQFMIEGENLDVKEVRSAFENLGESLIVIGDKNLLRVHIHALDTRPVMETAASFGSIVDIDIRDMDEQHQDFLMIKQNKAAKNSTAVIAVVNGTGLVNVFADLGVAAIVPGGQTMNPSTMDILQTVEQLDSENIIILPNNKNVVATANLITSLTEKHIYVIPTKTVPQGITALVEYVPEADYETNKARMSVDFSAVKTLEITRAVSSAKINGLVIRQGEYIGLIDGNLLAAGNSAEDVVRRLLDAIDVSESELITVYYGKDTHKRHAEIIGNLISERCPEAELGIVNGEQPHYSYIISVE